MKTTKLLTMAFAALVVCSCQTPMNINYFQDLQDGQSEAIQTVHEITVQPEDQLSIVVNSKDPLLADLFNLPIVTHRVGYSQQSSLNTSQAVSAYTVDHQGQIDFPVLGKVTVAGKNREQIAALIKSELIKRNLVNDPVVTVEFGNLYVSVLGEVARPGRLTAAPCSPPRPTTCSRKTSSTWSPTTPAPASPPSTATTCAAPRSGSPWPPSPPPSPSSS